MRIAQAYGSKNTTIKADVIERYVSTYGRALKEKGLVRSYVDAFAGSGWRDLGGGQSEPGAAIRVLQAEQPLERYVFGDLLRRNIASLQEEVAAITAARESQGLHTPQPDYFVGDAKELVARECAWVTAHPSRRTVMFLDPFGMQVRWATVEQIAATGRCDLWMLVPTGQALIRCMPKKGEAPPEHASAIDEYLGGPSWQSEFYNERAASSVGDLFGQTSKDRELVTANDIARFFIERRLKAVFRGGAHPTGLPLYRRGTEAFRLVFACANPSKAAHGLALRFASEFIRWAQTPR
ncbi:three-Cys-motif partner protein TcmP [Roseomonas sp. JC162]|uniref:Three-Cys-motif partner protein TcmP n=1 Tax=Neoroseomonas marina TaxID=1232220 RepID=A0A848EJD6_9PROT|nr:three-Cys-motif partner protein TcmP [Neoroseomonas marina]